MIVETRTPRTERQTLERRQLLHAEPNLVISSLSLDVCDQPHAPRVGAKGPAVISVALGGCGPNGGRVAVANGIGTGVIGPHAEGLWSEWIRTLALQDNLQPHVVERSGASPGITVARPVGPGRFDLDVQRIDPLTVAEFDDLTQDLVAPARSLFVGPMKTNDESLDLHQKMSRLARHRALMVHPSLLEDQELFCACARCYSFLQFNYSESQALDPEADTIEKLSCRIRYLLGDGIDFAITRGAETGLLWADREWHRIQPLSVETIVSDIGAGDVFGAAFFLSRVWFEAFPQSALQYALLAAAARIAGRAIPAYR